MASVIPISSNNQSPTGQNIINGNKSPQDPTISSTSASSNESRHESATKGTQSSNSNSSSSGFTPPPSGTSSKSVPKKVAIETMFETFHQSPNGEFKPTFYNPFEVKHRRRTSRSQFKTLEKAFMNNCKPSAVVRKSLAQELNMSARSIQVWFQNRRAKLKSMLKNGKMTDVQIMEYLNQQQNQHDSPSSFEDSENSECEDNANGRDENSSAPNEVLKSAFDEIRRTLPNPVSRPVGISLNQNTETMKFANSYPNQSRNRSYSLPEIQRSPQLPFKQLQAALFGGSNCHSSQQQQTNHSSQHVDNNNNYSGSINAFQHYLRASNAVMSQVNGNGNNYGGPNYPSASHPLSVQLPQLSSAYVPIPVHDQQNRQMYPNIDHNTSYQTDSNRLRPRSSSFAMGQRQFNGNPSNCDLSVIKEDSPISEYMSLPMDSTSGYYDASGSENRAAYFNPSNTDTLSNQINSLDLDYFMSSNQHHMNEFSSASNSHNSSSILQSPHDEHNSGAFLSEMNFFPQNTNEILLSTLIDDEHFLH